MEKRLFSQYRMRGFILLLLAVLLAVAGCSSSEVSPANTDSGGAGNANGGAAAPAPEAPPEAPPENYPSKNIEFIVGFGAGGGYDTWSRTLAPFLEKYLPGDYKVQVRNMEGGGGVKAAEALMRAGPDGHMLEIINLAGLAATQLVEDVSYDLNAFTWVARLNLDVNTLYVAPNGKYQSLQELVNATEPVIFSTRGLTTSDSITGAVLFSELGIEWKPLNHDSAGEAVLSVVRGDADVMIRTFNSGRDVLESGDLKAIGYFDEQPHPEFPDIPTAVDLEVPFMNKLKSSYVLAMAPNTDPQAAAIMEEAIKQATEDPEFLAALEKLDYQLSYLSGEDTAQLVKDLSETYVQYQENIKALFTK